VNLKLDENIGRRGRDMLEHADHDVATVQEQSMNSTDDRTLIQHCRDELRGLVTMDLDFSNPLIFDPSQYAGIAVLRLPRNATAQHLLRAVQTLITALKGDSFVGKLWIVEIGRIRIYQQETEQ
jgi:predicted nuclease of predicted toxin-antitoxin system